MSPWFGNVVFIAALVASVAIRVPHEKRSKETRVKETRRGSREIALLSMVAIGGLLLPLVYFLTPFLSFADRPDSGEADVLAATLLGASVAAATRGDRLTEE